MAMKHKNTLILAPILLFLTLFAYLQFQAREERFQPLKHENLLFPDLDTRQTDRIEIITPTKRTILEKQDNIWFLITAANFPAEEKLINILLKRVRTLKKGEVISDKPQKHYIFKVDGTGIKVKLLRKRESLQAAFYVGKTDENYVDTYVRKEGSGQVLVVPDNIRQIFTPYEWRSHYLFHFNAKDIREITITSQEEAAHIKQRADGSWEVKSQGTARPDERTIERLLLTLSSLRCVDFAKGEVDWEAPEKPKLKIKILLKDESVRTLVVGKALNPINFYVRVLEKEPIFLVPARWLDRLEQYTHPILRPETPGNL